MRHLLLFLLCGVSFGQVTAVFEPQSIEITNRLLGSRDFMLWTVTVRHADRTTDHVIPRNAIVGASVITELPTDMAADLMTRAARFSRLGIMGRGFDAASPLIGPGLVGYGFAADSRPIQWAGSAVAGLAVIRRLLAGSAPDPGPYLARLMPERLTCSQGDCGQFYAVTGAVRDAARFEVSALVSLDRERLEKILAVRWDVFGVESK